MLPKIIRNPLRATRMIQFIQRLPIIDGPAVGQRIIVEPWQEAWIRDTYEPEWEDGTRVVVNSGLTCARKNAKSFLTAGLLLGHLVGPEAVTNGQVYSCANDRTQAAVIFDMCRKMVEMSPWIQRYLTITSSTKTIFVHRSDKISRGSQYRALSAEAGTKHGYGADYFVYDELGEAANGELLDVMRDGQQARVSPLAVTLSTQNNDPESPFSSWMDDTVRSGVTNLRQPGDPEPEDPTSVFHVYAAPEGCDLMDKAGWYAANPCLGTWKKEEVVAIKAREAVRNPAREANFRRRYLNQRVSPHGSLVGQSDWRACCPAVLPSDQRASEQFDKGEKVYGGLDLSEKVDLTAYSLISAERSLVKTKFYKPQSYLEDHGNRDRVPYMLWAKQGWLTAVPGRTINPEFVARDIKDDHERLTIAGLAYDKHLMGELLRIFDHMGVATTTGDGAGLRIIEWWSSNSSMERAVSAFEVAVIEHKVKSDGNPCLTWNIMNAQVEPNSEGKRRFDKRASRFRIDGAVALAMAMGLRALDRTSTPAQNPWATGGFSLAGMN